MKVSASWDRTSGMHATWTAFRRKAAYAGAVLLLATATQGDTPYPTLVTAETRADSRSLAELEKPGEILFEDGFESPRSLENYFEIRGHQDGHAQLEAESSVAHSGTGCIRFTAPARQGDASGAGASYWFGPEGYDRIYFRRYIRFAADYHQGNLNHTGGGIAGVAGNGKWDEMGKAGLRPTGFDRFTSRFEPWCDWQREKPPGYMFLYTYWMDMRPGKDGQTWGNMLEPAKAERFVPQRDRWVCLEQMIKANDPGQANGELAAWIDGKLYIHYKGFRWRQKADVKLKRFNIGVYIHHAEKDNTVWYDDVALSTGYIGPK